MNREKILYLSNYVPEAITDVIRFNSYESRILLPNLCTYALNVISCVLYDEEIDGAVLPNSCDSIRAARVLALGNTNKFIHQIKHPLTFSSDSVRYYSHEIERYHHHYENHFNRVLPEAEIAQRLALLKEKWRFMKKQYDDIADISYYVYLKTINQALTRPLEEWRKILDINYPPARGSKRVFLIGPYLSELSIIQTIEANNGNIVGDDITNSKRYFHQEDFPVGVAAPRDIYQRLAWENLLRFPSSTLNRFGCIVEKDLEEIKRKGIQGVIFVYPPSCEPYGYLYPLLKAALEDIGIPSLKLEVDNGDVGGKIHETAAAAFLEML